MGVVHHVHTQQVYLPDEDLLELKCHPYVSPVAFQVLSSSLQILSISSQTVVMYMYRLYMTLPVTNKHPTICP